MQSGGDCYQAAGIFMMDMTMRADTPGVTLVHGLPTLRRPPWKKFGHAWCEYEVDGQMMVRDTANGRDTEMPRDFYYVLGNIDPEECRRYTNGDLRLWVSATGHWGPWEEEPDGVL